jgi:hypothetical protein
MRCGGSRESTLEALGGAGGRARAMRGTYAGTAFTVTLHDGTCSTRGDSVRVQYGSFDTSTLTAKHGNVHIEKD